MVSRAHKWAVAAVLALAVAGCNSGSGTAATSSAAPTTTGPTKAEFVTEANAVCSKHRAVVEAAASKALAGGQLPSPEAFGKLAMETIVPELTAQFTELKTVTPPPELATPYSAYVAAGDTTVAAISANPALITDATNFMALNKQGDDVGLNPACRVGPG